MTIRYLHTVCLACNREPGVPLCPLCAAIVDAEEEAARVDVTPPTGKDEPHGIGPWHPGLRT
jgi:hypothetical protein